MGPQQVPDLRLHFLSKWREGGQWDRAAITERFSLPWGERDLRPERHWHLNHLRSADLWYVAAGMIDVVLAMAKRLPRDVRPHELDIDWPLGERAGLVVFERSIKGVDSRVPDHVVETKAILFGPTLMGANPVIGRQHDEACVSISSYTFRRWEDGLEPEMMAMAMDLGEMPSPIEGTHQRNGDGQRSFAGRGAFWCPLGRSDWPLTDALCTPIDTDPLTFADTLDASAEEDRRLLAALLLVASQPRISERVSHRPDKGAWKRSKRENVTSEVQVIRLRRRKAPGDDSEPTGESRDWSCHWMVKAHPRWQPCGPGRSQRKLITVVGHIKGDLSKPFKEPPEDTVYGLVQ